MDPLQDLATIYNPTRNIAEGATPHEMRKQAAMNLQAFIDDALKLIEENKARNKEKEQPAVAAKTKEGPTKKN